MAGIHTSNITSAANNGDVTIDPNGSGKTKIKSVDSTNPGTTPVSTASDGTVQRLDIDALQELSEADLDDNDLVMVQDISDGGAIKKIKKSKVKNFRTAGFNQPPFPDPLPGGGTWVDVDSVLGVKAGGNGSTADLKNSVEFAVQDNIYNQNDKNVVASNTVKIRWMESKKNTATHGQTISGTLYAKSGSSYEQTWNLTIVKQPTLGWDLLDLTGQPVSTQVASSLTTPTGMNAASPVTIDGGTLTSIQVSVNGAAFTSTPGNILSGQTIQVRGTTGAANSTGYTALVSIGGLQRTWNVETVATAPAVKQPAVTSPVNNATGLGKSITAFSSAYQALNGAGTHTNSDWELKKNGSVVSSSTASTSDKTSWTIPPSVLEPNTSYTIRVKYRSSDPVDSSWSAESAFSTGSFVAQTPSSWTATPWGGMFNEGEFLQRGVTYINGTYVVAARLQWNETNKIFTSADPTLGSWVDTGYDTATNARFMCTLNNKAYWFSMTMNQPVMKSTDGTHWVNVPSLGLNVASDANVGKNGRIIVSLMGETDNDHYEPTGYDQPPENHLAVTDNEGSSWMFRKFPGTSATFQLGSIATDGNGTWISTQQSQIGHPSSDSWVGYWKSTDNGDTWAHYDTSPNSEWTRAAYVRGLGQFCMLDTTGQTATSPDGINWTIHTNPWRKVDGSTGTERPNLPERFHSDNNTIWVGDQNIANRKSVFTWYSIDGGETFIEHATVSHNRYQDLAYGNGYWISAHVGPDRNAAPKPVEWCTQPQ